MHSAGNGLIFTWKTVFKFVQMASGKRSLLYFKIGQLCFISILLTRKSSWNDEIINVQEIIPA